MATDPVRRMQFREYDSPLDSDIIDPLRRLARQAPSHESPYLTVTLYRVGPAVALDEVG